MTTIFATPLGRRSLFTGASALALVAGLPSLGLTQGASPPSGGDPLLEPETVTANPDTHRLDVAIDAVYGYYDLNRRPVALRSYDGGGRVRAPCASGPATRWASSWPTACRRRRPIWRPTARRRPTAISTTSARRCRG
ncbi:hypothetical protein ACIU1J_22190 [Azospirillum doebereinerae]|uniref:hypothetical protein n=1 Tax=Azospirillum doebereinerae TaxID=92933 RepID=UPI00384EC272